MDVGGVQWVGGWMDGCFVVVVVGAIRRKVWKSVAVLSCWGRCSPPETLFGPIFGMMAVDSCVTLDIGCLLWCLPFVAIHVVEHKTGFKFLECGIPNFARLIDCFTHSVCSDAEL